MEHYIEIATKQGLAGEAALAFAVKQMEREERRDERETDKRKEKMQKCRKSVRSEKRGKDRLSVTLNWKNFELLCKPKLVKATMAELRGSFQKCRCSRRAMIWMLT